ncbi:glycosyltransferase family 4 protein [Thioalkalivibrio sp. ALE11]|uniref:glycosyltransferase family 4 protein n=1 Tax=Thioalkalivibrio sp. ALE11 TaxID=1265494 RepID=UPI0009DA9B10|nr:glycosyltransferase family 4 protein [Thioalkalivibrio sp. ALE11]
MVVWNTFENDARVLKEAQTLSAQGYSVTVHALHVAGYTERQETLEPALQVVRVPTGFGRRKRKAPRGADTQERGAFEVTPSGAAAAAPAQRVGPLRGAGLVAGRLGAHVRLLLAMVRMRPDVVHAHDVNTLPTAWLAARLSRARLVYDAHEISTSREGYQSFRRLVASVERFVMPRADGTITTTDRRAAFFARAYGVPRPLVLQNRPRKQTVTGGTRIRDELGLDQPRPVVLYQGGLQPGRGLDRIVDAAARVPEAWFVFIGGGRMAPQLEEQVRTLGLQDRVRFIPTVSLEDMPSYTASADIGVQAIENTCLNHSTTDSNKLFEYVAAGLPVVASNFPEIRKIVREHDIGLLVPSDDTDALADAIGRLAGDAALRARYADNAGRAAAVLTWEEQEAWLVSLYQTVLQSS